MGTDNGTIPAPIQAAVIGVGHLGRHHARLMQQVPGVELLGVVDNRPEQGQEIADGLGVAAWESVDELPESVRAVSVAVPTFLHHQVVCPLLERGIHVLVEKPMAATLEEARAMAALATDRGLVLQVGHVERFNPALSVMKGMGVAPRFIEAERLAPFTYRALDVSVVMDLMIHDLDIVMELADSPLAEVAAVGSRVLGRHTDIANARLTFENGCVANVTASRVSFEPQRKTRVFGDDTFVSMDFGSRRAFVVKRHEGFDLGSLSPESAATFEPKASFKEFLEQGLMDTQEIDMDECNPLLSEITAFIDAVRGNEGDATGVTAAQGLRAMEVALRVSEQIETHSWS
ncbi:MAG: Gfo/Idh/MocA family oxidoreductase [Planctomycetota bacterium]